MATKRTKPPTSSAKSLKGGGIDITPDLTNTQRQSLRHKNLESLMAHPTVREQMDDYVVTTAFGGNPDASPSERNFCLGIVADAHYGKHRGQEDTPKTDTQITIRLNGREFNPVTGEVGQTEHETLGMTKREYVEAAIAGTLPTEKEIN